MKGFIAFLLVLIVAGLGYLIYDRAIQKRAAAVPLPQVSGTSATPAPTPAPTSSQLAIARCLQALRKVEAATQVGCTYVQYRELLIEAKAQVNEASALVTDSDSMAKLQWTMDAYDDGKQFWEIKIRDGAHGDWIFNGNSRDRAFQPYIKKYSLEINVDDGKGGYSLDYDKWITQIWVAASAHLNQL